MRADLEQKIPAVLPAGEVYLGGFTTSRSPYATGTGGCDVPDKRRPRVLADGRSRSGDFLGKFGEFVFRFLTADFSSPGQFDRVTGSCQAGEGAEAEKVVLRRLGQLGRPVAGSSSAAEPRDCHPAFSAPPPRNNTPHPRKEAPTSWSPA